jgi:membrane-associated PAP2 superfamily phosphatase
MQEHTEQYLDKLAKKVMQSTPLEKPSLDFTANIMSKVSNIASNDITVYKPLISKRMWLVIAVLVVGSLFYGIFGSGLEAIGWFDKVDLSVISNNKITETISGIRFSKTLVYAIGLCGLVFFIQIPMMKHYLDKRLEY